MTINPFDNQLKKESKKASDLNYSLKKIKEDLDWFENTDLEKLFQDREELLSATENQSRECVRLRAEAAKIKSNLDELLPSVNSLWNPKNWFDSKQRSLRERSENLKQSLSRAEGVHFKSQERLQDAARRKQYIIEEIGRYNEFDFDARSKDRSSIERELRKQTEVVEIMSERKRQVDIAIEPILRQINEAERARTEAAIDNQRAQALDNELSRADNSYEKAMVHQTCEERFGTGSPRKVMSEKGAEIRRLDRDIEKLTKRMGNVVQKASRCVRKLILDGNNLCYEGSFFLGLDALRAVVPILADTYDVTVVFDASIRRALNHGDAEVREAFGNTVKVHIVASSVKADETVLDLAGSDETAYIISNDRFGEFGEKPAVRDQRMIRHEIVAGQVLIHDLGVSEAFKV